MPEFKARSINSQLTRFSFAAFVVLASCLTLGGIAMFRTVARWQVRVTPRLAHSVIRAFERQAEAAALVAEEHAHDSEAAALLPPRSRGAATRRFAAAMTRWPARRGYTFVLVADASHEAVFRWSRANGTGGALADLPAALFEKLDSAGIASGYLRVGDEVMVVGGAGLRGADGARIPGYLLLGRTVDTTLLRALGGDLTARLTLRTDALSPVASTSGTTRGDTLIVRQPLTGIFGSSVGTLEAAFDVHALRTLLRWAVVELLLALLAGGAALGIVWSAWRRLLVTPVRAMSREVETMRESRALHEISGDVPAAEWAVLRSTFNETVRTLHDWQQRYRDVFDRAADALFLLDPATGTVIDANPATAVLTGIAPDAIIGQKLPADLLPGGLGQRVVRWRRTDGVTQTWGVAASEIALENGPATLAAYRDLTGREEMAHAQKMEAVGSLAGGIAHDFNNLLGAVLTGTAAARTMIAQDHPAVAALDGIEHAGTRAAELTQQLLRFSRHDPLRLAPVDLGQAVETVGRICSRTFDRRVVVDVWAPTDLPPVLGDTGEIEQALLNLCINARDAMPEGGSLRVEARRDDLDAHQARIAGVPKAGAYVVISVADTGVGMTDEVKARLFEPFFTTKETGKGTGLGLSLVYGLMRQLGGAITVRSVVQRGTRVTLLFPVLALRPGAAGKAPARPEPATPLRRTPVGGRRPLILVIDDERALREMMRLVLDLSGFEVAEAADGASGVALLRERRTEVRAILLDVQLPGQLSGAETLEHIRAIDADVPVLLCTGFVREDELARMRMLHVDDVLLKPVNVSALLARLDELSRAPRGGVPSASVPSAEVAR